MKKYLEFRIFVQLRLLQQVTPYLTFRNVSRVQIPHLQPISHADAPTRHPSIFSIKAPKLSQQGLFALKKQLALI